MPRGAPDFASYSVLAGISRVQDFGEVGTRLGGFFPYDREGSIYYFDTFSVLSWSYLVEHVYPDQVVFFVSHRRLWGQHALRIKSQNAVTTPAYIYLGLPPFPEGKLGIGAVVACAGVGDEVYMRIYQDQNHTRYAYEVRYRVIEKDISVRDASGAWQVVASPVEIVTGTHMWNFMKLVVDLDMHQYVRFKLNTKTYELSGIGAYTSPITTADILIPAWGGRGATSETSLVDFGAVFVTTNEV